MLIKRNYPELLSYIKSVQSVLVLGPRATGKTSFISAALLGQPNVLRIDLLRFEDFNRYLKEPYLLRADIELLASKSSPLHVFIDEVQRIPQLLNEVHSLLNKYEGKICFILSGSSARKLKSAGANLLAGRALKFSFHPLSIDEVSIADNLELILQWGLLPQSFAFAQLISSNPEYEKTVERYLRTYSGIYLNEEIRQETEVQKLDSFARLLEFAAANNGEPVNQRKAAKVAGVHAETTKDYYQVLLDTLIAWELPAWTHSIQEKLQKSSKFYLFDNGVLNSLIGDLSSPPKPGTYRYGRLFENLCITEILKRIELKMSPLKAFHYRDQKGNEIDLILQKNAYSGPIAVEIKSDISPDLVDLSVLAKFSEKYPKSRCIVLCRTPRAYQLKRLEILPFVEGIRSIVV